MLCRAIFGDSNFCQIFFFCYSFSDKEAPNIKCPENIVNNTKPGSPNATVVWSDPIVTDNSGQDVTFFGDEHSGSTFDIGSHVVIYNATDSSNNTNYCNFTIQVIGKYLIYIKVFSHQICDNPHTMLHNICSLQVYFRIYTKHCNFTVKIVS